MRFHLRAAVLFATVFSFVPAAQSQQVGSGELVRAATALSEQAEFLNENQWVQLDGGLLRGSVSTLVGSTPVPQVGVTVSLMQDGQTVMTKDSDVEGDFLMENVLPGSYSLVVQGKQEGHEQVAVCSLTILSETDGAHLPNRMNVQTISPATPRISELLRGNTMPHWTVGDTVQRDVKASTRKFADSYQVAIDAQGRISGIVSRANASVDLSSTLVYLTRDGREVARARAASNGAYQFEGVIPGAYGLVASGPEGIAAVGFFAVSADNNIAKIATGSTRLVNKNFQPATAAATQMNVELAEPNSYVPAEIIPGDQIAACDGAACPTMGGCCGGGMTGGGGGGGGGAGGGLGGWGALAAIGGLTAVGIIAGTNNNNNTPIVVSPVSP